MLSAVPGAGCWRSALWNGPLWLLSASAVGVPRVRWGKWERNKCYLFDKLKFTLSLPAGPLGSSPWQGILDSLGLLTGNQDFPNLCLSFPICHGRGNTPCSGLKGFLVVPKVVMSSSDVPAPKVL